MEHNFIDLNADSAMRCQVIHQKENNLDGIDNLDQLPEEPAVFAVCGRVNGKPANARYVAATSNLRKEIQNLFDKHQPAPAGFECFKEFMVSIKTKALVYKLVSGAAESARDNEKTKWMDRFQPKCNEELNEIH